MIKNGKLFIWLFILVTIINAGVLLLDINIIINLILFIVLFILLLIKLNCTKKVSKALKIVISLILIGIILWFSMMTVDFSKALSENSSTPIFAKEIKSNTYKGLGYKIEFNRAIITNEEYTLNAGVSIYIFDRFITGWIS